MKLSKIKTLIKFKKSALPILEHGVLTGRGLEFSDLNTTIIIKGVSRPLGTTYDIISSGIIEVGKLSEDEYSDYPNTKPEGNLKLKFKTTESLRVKLPHVVKFCGTDELRPVMEGVYFEKGRITATDAHVLSSMGVATFTEDVSFTVSKNMALFIAESTVVALYENHIACSIPIDGYDCVVISRLIDGKFPEYKAVIPSRDEYRRGIKLLGGEVTELLNRSKIADSNTCACEIDSKKGIKVGSYTVGIPNYAFPSNDDVALLMPMMRGDDETYGEAKFDVRLLKKTIPGCSAVYIHTNKEEKHGALLLHYALKAIKQNPAEKIEPITTPLKRTKPEVKESVKSIPVDALEDYFNKVIKVTLKRMARTVVHEDVEIEAFDVYHLDYNDFALEEKAFLSDY